MGRTNRVEAGGYVYHVLNRGNGRMTIFEDAADYAAFERVLEQALARFPQMDLLAYCLMPNHWHWVVRPCVDGLLSRFVGWLTLTHTQRWHAHRHTIGGGHVYRGRYKSFLVDTEGYLATVCRYVERNPVRAQLVEDAERWQWSSLWRWCYGNPKEKGILAPWPMPGGRRPRNWVKRVNCAETQEDLEMLRLSSNRGQPLGGQLWRSNVIKQFGLESTFQARGRPKKLKKSP